VEGERRVGEEDLVRFSHLYRLSLFVEERHVAEKIREVVERLVKHEHGTVEVRAEKAAAEARSDALMERLVSYSYSFCL
jgi:hypothetical protein